MAVKLLLWLYFHSASDFVMHAHTSKICNFLILHYYSVIFTVNDREYLSIQGNFSKKYFTSVALRYTGYLHNVPIIEVYKPMGC